MKMLRSVNVLVGRVFLLVTVCNAPHQLPLSISDHLRRPYQRYLTTSVERVQTLGTSTEGGRTERGRLGKEEKNMPSKVNDTGGEVLSKVVRECTV